MVFHWSLSDNKSPLVSCTLLSILVNTRFVVWIISFLSQIFYSSSLFSRFSESVPSAPTTIGITVTFMFYSFFQVSSKVQVFVQLFTAFHFCLLTLTLVVVVSSLLLGVLSSISRPGNEKHFGSMNKNRSSFIRKKNCDILDCWQWTEPNPPLWIE